MSVRNLNIKYNFVVSIKLFWGLKRAVVYLGWLSYSHFDVHDTLISNPFQLSYISNFSNLSTTL